MKEILKGLMHDKNSSLYIMDHDNKLATGINMNKHINVQIDNINDGSESSKSVCLKEVDQ